MGKKTPDSLEYARLVDIGRFDKFSFLAMNFLVSFQMFFIGQFHAAFLAFEAHGCHLIMVTDKVAKSSYELERVLFPYFELAGYRDRVAAVLAGVVGV